MPGYGTMRACAPTVRSKRMGPSQVLFVAMLLIATRGRVALGQTNNSNPAAPLVPRAPASVSFAPLATNAVPTESSSLWRNQWPTFRMTELIATIAAGAVTGAIVLYGPIEHPRWKGGILFDDTLREQFRARDPATHKTFRALGDYTYRLSPVLPLADALIVATLAHADSKLAANLTLITLEAYSYSGAASFISTELTARQRPDGSDTQSFFSGHTAIAATGAGLTCANHSRIALWGNAFADAAACIFASANALTTAATRIVADYHYTTDAIAGLLVGFGFGYAVPVLLHYSYAGEERSIALGPGPTRGGSGITVRGTF